MDEENGIDLLQIVQTSDRLKNIPFILMSGDSELAEIKNTEQEYGVDYLEKPFSPDSFLEKVLDLDKLTRKNGNYSR